MIKPVHVLIALVVLAWAYMLKSGLQLLADQAGQGRSLGNALLICIVFPLVGTGLSIALPIWALRRKKAWLAMIAILVSLAVLVWGTVWFFLPSGG